MWRLAFYSHLHDRIISLIGRLLSIKLVWPRHVLLKCLYQARKVNGDIFVCWCIYLVSFYTVTYLCVGEYICLFLYGDIFVCWCIYLVSFYTVTYLCVGVYILSLSIRWHICVLVYISCLFLSFYDWILELSRQWRQCGVSFVLELSRQWRQCGVSFVSEVFLFTSS